MSAENVDLIKAMVERVNATGDPEAAFDVFDPDVEFEMSWRSGRESADFRVIRGLDEVRAAVAEILGPFEGVRYEVHDYVDAGDEVVVIQELLVRPTGASGEISTGRFGYVYAVREGRIVRVQDFPDPAEALRAAGAD